MANSGEKSAPAVPKRRYVARTERAAGTKGAKTAELKLAAIAVTRF